MVIGAVAYFIFPNFPRSGPKKWLTDQEQRYAEYRLALFVNKEIRRSG